MTGPWSKWTQEDWSNAEFCENCGLPLICVEPEEGETVGQMMCVYCTWMEDESIIRQQLEVKNRRLQEELKAAISKAKPLGG
jgi:hypothetical protein